MRIVSVCNESETEREDTLMSKRYVRLTAALLSLLLLGGVALTSCEKPPVETSSSTADSETVTERPVEESTRESDTAGETVESHVNGSATDETESRETESETAKETEPPVGPTLELPNGDLIMHTAALKDGVNAYYADPLRSSVIVENQSMTLIHGLNGGQGSTNVQNLVNSITDKKGNLYIENTMDAFVKTTSGKTYYASRWMTGSSMNILRGGVYYQDVRISDQGFADAEAIAAGAKEIELTRFVSTGSDATSHGVKDGVYSFTVNKLTDPGVVNKKASFEASEYNALLLTIKTDNAYFGEVFVKNSKMGNFTSKLSKYFSIIPGDDYHTYVIRLNDLEGYTGEIDSVRFDIGGGFSGEKIYIKSVKAINLDDNSIPVRFERKLHTYSDKLHEELHFVTTNATDALASYGMVTKIAADTVEKVFVKDKNGAHYSFEDIDWASAEYVGFDIKNAGIFGYILAKDEGSGKLTVTLEDGTYKITQEMKVTGSVKDKSHFYMGHRIYTDTSHSFGEFVKQAQIEREPLSEKSFAVRYVEDDPTMFAKYIGYDPLRGAYGISLSYTDFNRAYYQHWNQHFRAYVTVKGDNQDRNIYLYTYTNGDQLECAALLDENDMVLPVQLQVIKNFTNDGEESIFVHDVGYSETILPLNVEAGSKRSFSVLNLYQNWGNYPLKQLSWIQYSSPYYHLSTGVTETNCIEPMYGGNAFQMVNDVENGIVYEFHVTSGKSLHTLPDFRPMSQDFWKDQPQHYSAANITWLEYTDAEGNYNASDFTNDVIDSYGPIYADITMDYISDDGKITGQTRHVEMPQTDENRTYYTLKYDVNESISFQNFTEDFTIIEINSRWGDVLFKKLGYLDENNNCAVKDTNFSTEGRYTKLGTEAPYFDLYAGINQSCRTNYGLVVKSVDIKLGGKQYEGNLMLEDWVQDSMVYTRLTLDAGEITLLPGDYIHIDMILLPWGDVNSPDDSNVRQVRKDSCLEPFKVTPTVGSVVEDTYIPGVRAENNVAEFTFSGGHNNGVVRVYGFDILTRPTVSELIDGKWVEVDISSKEHPDKGGNAHYYDGYIAYYDGDGTYSYAFVIDTDRGKARQFRVSAAAFEAYPEVETGEGDGIYTEPETEFESVPMEEETAPVGPNAPVLYYSAQTIYLTAKETVGSGRLQGASLRQDEDGTKYARLQAEAGAQEAVVILTGTTEPLKGGKYLSFKYRTVTEGGYHESWLNSNSMSPENSVKQGYKTDGEWQYYVVDAANAMGSYDGESLQYFRFDFMNVDSGIPTGAYLDIAYIGLFDSENDAMKFGLGDAYKTPEEQKAELNGKYIDPASGYKASEVVYGSTLDFVNGTKVTDAGGNSKYGASVVAWNSASLDNCGVVFTGWAVADGGIAKYIWSADQGKTWFEIEPHIIKGVGSDAGGAHYHVVSLKIGAYTFSEGSNVNTTFQNNDGGGLMANLVAYKGQTVDVIFAAVPEKDPRALCLLAVVTGVNVTGETDKTPKPDTLLDPDAMKPVEVKYADPATLLDPASAYKPATVAYGCSLDMINGIGERATSPTLANNGGNSKAGCAVYDHKVNTIRGAALVFSGWSVADGGIEKYVWSADGGKTWHTVPGDPGDGAGAAHYQVVQNAIGSHTFSEGSHLNTTYQGGVGAGENVTGLTIDLSSYAGQTVRILFGAVPVQAPDSVCLIACLNNVHVAG